MNINHFKAMFLRHLYPLKRDVDIWTEIAYWPIIDTLVWGITSQWLGEGSAAARVIVAVLSGLVFWNILWRSQAEVARNLMEEIWNNNLVNLFATPLRLSEWIASVLLLSFLKSSITVLCLVPAVYLLYQVNIFQIGAWLPVLYLNVAMTGWWVGFISAGVVIRWGQRVQSIIWTLPGILIPFSAVFFPLSSLPAWLQPIARLIPSTYVFESMRSLVHTQQLQQTDLLISFGLNAVYLALAITLFVTLFRKSLTLGLNRFD